MTTLLRKAGVATVLGLSCALSAHAASYSRYFDVGLVEESHGQVINTKQGSFSDLFTFSVVHNVGTNLSAQALTVSSIGTSLDSIRLYAGSFDSVAALSGARLISSSLVEATVKGVRTADNLYLDFTSLAAHTAYTLVINGSVSMPGGSHYTTLVKLAPAPEPETYAMLLAGLGLTGALARRRRKSTAI